MDPLNRKAAEILANQECQTTLPGARNAAAEELSDSSQDFSLFGGAGLPLGLTAFWIFIVLASLAILVFAVRGWSGRFSGSQPREVDQVVRVTRRQGAAFVPLEPLPDFEALAAAGDFRGALHGMLLHALRKLSNQDSGQTERWQRLELSDTAREAIRLVPDRTDARRALTALVHAVEGSRFGKSQVDVRTFEEGRKHYQAWQRAHAT